MKPVGNHILIRHAIAPPKTEGGIDVPDRYREKAQEGVVVALGRGTTVSISPERLVEFHQALDELKDIDTRADVLEEVGRINDVLREEPHGIVPIDDIKVGDRVLFEKRAGQDVTYGDQKYRVLPYEQVALVLETK